MDVREGPNVRRTFDAARAIFDALRVPNEDRGAVAMMIIRAS